MRAAIIAMTLIIQFAGFADHNGNWALDSGERMAGGQFRVYVTAADGAVSMFEVAVPQGHWWKLEAEPGDRIEIESRCGGRITVQSGNEWYVPVVCRSIFAPMIGGGG